MSNRANPHPPFAPEGFVFKKFKIQKEGDQFHNQEGEYAEVVSGWIVRLITDEVIFVPRSERR